MAGGMEDINMRSNQSNGQREQAGFRFPGIPSRLVQSLSIVWNRELNQVQGLKKMTKKQFKHYNDLPLARIKRIMKSDEEVDMISAEAPILFAKACELFILDITTRANYEAETESRNNIEKEDFFAVFHKTIEYDFLSAAVQEMMKEQQQAKRKLEESDQMYLDKRTKME